MAHGSVRKLLEVKGISEVKAQKLKETIKNNQLVTIGFQTASSRLEVMKDIIMISTGREARHLLKGASKRHWANKGPRPRTKESFHMCILPLFTMPCILYVLRYVIISPGF